MSPLNLIKVQNIESILAAQVGRMGYHPPWGGRGAGESKRYSRFTWVLSPGEQVGEESNTFSLDTHSCRARGLCRVGQHGAGAPAQGSGGWSPSLSGVLRGPTDHCPAHCHTWVPPDCSCDRVTIVAPWPAPWPVAERAAAEGWGSLRKAGTFRGSDSSRQIGRLRNWVPCLKNLVPQQRLPERARLSWTDQGHQPGSVRSSRYLRGGVQLPPTVWPQPPSSAPSPRTGPGGYQSLSGGSPSSPSTPHPTPRLLSEHLPALLRSLARLPAWHLSALRAGASESHHVYRPLDSPKQELLTRGGCPAHSDKYERSAFCNLGTVPPATRCLFNPASPPGCRRQAEWEELGKNRNKAQRSLKNEQRAPSWD